MSNFTEEAKSILTALYMGGRIEAGDHLVDEALESLQSLLRTHRPEKLNTRFMDKADTIPYNAALDAVDQAYGLEA